MLAAAQATACLYLKDILSYSLHGMHHFPYRNCIHGEVNQQTLTPCYTFGY